MKSSTENITESKITGLRSNDLQDVLQKLDPKVVAFDIFDTVIHRHVHPEDVKKIAAARTLDAIPLSGLSWDQLYGFRNELERIICLENNAQGKDMEFSFPYFCQRQFDHLVEKGFSTKLPPKEQFCSVLNDIELSVEESVQYSDVEVTNTVIQLHRQGVPIYFLSDFYLPPIMLAEMLSWHGLEGYYEKIFASSDFLETKRTGKLYSHFLSAVEATPDSIVMVGDNEDVDGVMAVNAGLKSICIDRSDKRSKYASYARSFSDKKNIYHKLDLLFENDGIFPEFSLSLFNFTRKLHKRLLADGVKDVFFLSREGQPLKRMFDIYQESIQAKGAVHVKSHYFLASRRSTFLPSLDEIDQEDFHVLFRQYRKISLNDFFLSLGFDDHLSSFAQELAVDPYLREEDFPTSETFLRLLENKRFRDLYEKQRVLQRDNFINYLQGFGVDVSSHGMALVDVGWKGSIQDNISRIVEDLCPVDGYYLGILAPGAEHAKKRKAGILFSSLQGASRGFFIFRENTALFEVVLAADHGSISHYEDNGGVGVGMLEDFTPDAPLYENKISPLLIEQESRFKEICDILVRHPVDDDLLDTFTIRKHARMVYFPRPDELNWFSSIYHRENFGLFGESEFCAECRVTIKERLTAFFRLVKTPRSFLEATFWPALKLKQEGLGFAIWPYNKYRMFRQIQRGEF